MPFGLRGVALLLLSIAFGPAGCAEESAPTDERSGTDIERLDGRMYLSTSVSEDGESRPLAAGTRIQLQFHGDDLTMEAGCNLLGLDNIRQDGDRLVAGQLATTEVGCHPDSADQDKWLLDFMAGEPTMQLDGDVMRLISGDVTIELIDAAVAEPAQPMVGTRWRINTIIYPRSSNTVAEDAEAFVVFDDDGTLSGRTACNSFSAEYERDDSTLIVTWLDAGTSPCQGDGAELEAALLDVLSGDPSLARVTNQLTLFADGKGVSLRTP